MASSLKQYMCYLITLSICIDQGDGRWRERDKENLRHDIELYKRMAEKIEREIDAFYDEYPDERLKGDNADGIHYKHLTNILIRNTETTKENEYIDRAKQNYSLYNSSKITSSISSKFTTEENYSDKTSIRVSIQNMTDLIDKSYEPSMNWPKFDEILLAMGKKYDWKTDTWIKVKARLKKSKVKGAESVKTKNGNVNFHEKHKFNYRIVKLNKSKSRRNVVVAVSAVR